MLFLSLVTLLTAGLAVVARDVAPHRVARSRKIRHGLTTRAAVLPTGWSYVGCRQDGAARLLSGSNQQVTTNSVESCIAFCVGGGYIYAGMEYSSQCFCGNTLNSALGQTIDEGQCPYPCAGNSAELCGGSYTMSLYKYATTSASTTWTALGCYSDGTSTRTLSGPMTSISNMTPGQCQTYCSSQGYSYAGIEYSTQCFCGNSISSSLKTSSSTCSYKCPGDSSNTCGGWYALNVWQVGTTSPSSSSSSVAPSSSALAWTQVGCFSDSGSTRALTGPSTDIANATPALCQSYCAAQGYKYAGLEYKTQCYCGASIDMTKSISTSTCGYACPGDSTKTCGGWYAIQVWSSSTATSTSSSAVATPTGWSSLGCLADNPRIFTYEYDSASVTPEWCQALCLSKGYKYAGVEYGYQCFCGSTLTSSTTSTNCNVACQGDTTKTCGGSYALNAYVYNGVIPTTTSATSTSAPAATATGWNSLGCFVDTANPRVLPLEYDSNSNTPAFCQSYCLSQGYKYAGVEYGAQCFCGSSMASSVTSTGCTQACNGDSSKICGGGNAINVYLYNGAISTTSTSTSTSATNAPSPTFSIAAVTGVATPPSSSSTKALYAHHMIGNTYYYTYAQWQSEIGLAAGAGIDGFALNLGTTTGSQGQNIAWSYQAAQAQGNFKNFLSFDFTAVSCSSASDAQAVAALINTYASNSAQVVYKSKTLVSSFAGDACTFGQGNTLAGFNYVRSLLTTPMYFIPAIFTDPSTFTQASQAWFDGELNWNSGWPTGAGNLDTSSDTQYQAALGSKAYMPAVSPAFFTYYACGNGGWCKDWIYRSDNWLLATRMEQLISFRNSVDFAELISWNDFGESHYVGPLGQGTDLAMSQGWTNNMPHTAWLKVIAFYAPAFKTGSYPSSTDQIVLWTRPHPKGASPSSPTVGRPTRADDTDDNLYAFVTLSAAAAVKIYSGANTYTWNLPAGPSKLSIANAAGAIGGTIVRSGATVKSYDSTGSFSYTLTPTDYNFNYFVAST